MFYYSITFRPTLEEFQEVHEDVANAIISCVDEYYIGYEKGEEEVDSHLQCHVISKSKRTADLRQKIKKHCKFEFTPVNLVIKLITKNPLYQLGYCLKEKGPFLTNFPEITLNKAIVAYTDAVVRIDPPVGSSDKGFKKKQTSQYVYDTFWSLCQKKGIIANITHFKTFAIHLLDVGVINLNTYNRMNWKNVEEIIELKVRGEDKDLWKNYDEILKNEG